MSTNSQEQEIDLSQVFKKIHGFFASIIDSFFDFLLFLKKNIIVITILFIIGIGLGLYLDKNNSVYDNAIIVAPNFGSNDYLYAKVELLNAKKTENDTLFLSALGIKNSKNMGKIKIEPIIDVYKFIANKPENLDLIKLMAEDGDLQKIIKNDLTSKNYPFHIITFVTTKKTDYNETVVPILAFLNNSEYFNQIKEQVIENAKIKMIANDSTIAQINKLLNDFSSNKDNQKSDKLVYYNENNQLNEIIKTKDQLISEQGNNRMSLINSNKIIKDISIIINSKNTKVLNNKLTLILPFVFVFLYVFLAIFRRFYKAQVIKRNLA